MEVNMPYMDPMGMVQTPEKTLYDQQTVEKKNKKQTILAVSVLMAIQKVE